MFKGEVNGEDEWRRKSPSFDPARGRSVSPPFRLHSKFTDHRLLGICMVAITVAADSPGLCCPLSSSTTGTSDENRIFPKTEISLSTISLLLDDPVFNGSSNRGVRNSSLSIRE